MKTFTVKIVEGAKKPLIYIDEEKEKEVTCDDVIDNSMLCHIDNTVLTDTKDYSVYYNGICNKIYPAGITLESSIAVDVEVNNLIIVNSQNEICSREPITGIKITTNSTEPKEVENIVLSKENSDFSIAFGKCETTEDYVFCSEPEKEVQTGTYKLTEVNGVENNFIITAVESKKISYEVDYISVATEITHQINNEKLSFELQLTQQTSDVSLYVETKDKPLSCVKKDNLLYECTPDDTIMPISKTYELFYIPSCKDTLETTNIKVDYSVTITVTEFSLAEGKTCSKEEIASIVISTNKKPTQDIVNAIIEHTDGSRYTFTTCAYSETTVTCSGLETSLKRGTYKLYSMSGKDTFVTSGIEATTIKYDPEMISTETKLNQVVDRSNEEFTIILTEENIEQLTFFVGDSQDKRLVCEQKGINVVCTTNDNLMPSNGDYEIYYIGSCSEFIRTNIAVKREKVFSVTNITLPNEQMCMIEPFTSIIITLDAKPTNAITAATITDGVNEYKFITCVDDEETHTIITCTEPDKVILANKYTLLSMEGPDSYDVSPVQNTFVKYELDPLGTQTTSQIINNDTKTFTVKLASEETYQPVIYLNETEPIEFSCTKEGTTLKCDYNEFAMPENGEYEILYEGACRFPGTTNIKVTRLLPVTVTSISIGTGEAVCTGEGINEITITTDIKPFTQVTSIIITDESTDYSIENCTVSGVTVTCNTPATQIEYGVYKIKEVEAGEVYDVLSLNITEIELKFEEDILGELQIENNTNFVIDNETLSFTITGENIKELPSIYAGNDETNEIYCNFAENESTIIICTPDTVNMNENKVYDIYYKGPCGVLKSTGITVENRNAPETEEPDPEVTIEIKGDYLFIRKLVLSLTLFLL